MHKAMAHSCCGTEYVPDTPWLNVVVMIMDTPTAAGSMTGARGVVAGGGAGGGNERGDGGGGVTPLTGGGDVCKAPGGEGVADVGTTAEGIGMGPMYPM